MPTYILPNSAELYAVNINNIRCPNLVDRATDLADKLDSTYRKAFLIRNRWKALVGFAPTWHYVLPCCHAVMLCLCPALGSQRSNPLLVLLLPVQCNLYPLWIWFKCVMCHVWGNQIKCCLLGKNGRARHGWRCHRGKAYYIKPPKCSLPKCRIALQERILKQRIFKDVQLATAGVLAFNAYVPYYRSYPVKFIFSPSKLVAADLMVMFCVPNKSEVRLLFYNCSRSADVVANTGIRQHIGTGDPTGFTRWHDMLWHGMV